MVENQTAKEKREKTPSFVLTLEMDVSQQVVSIIEKELEICRVIYNTCLGELLKRYEQMTRLKSYKKIRRQLSVVSKSLAYYEENNKKSEKYKYYKNEKDILMKQIFNLQDEFGVTEYAMHEFVKQIRKHFGNKVNSAITQKIATRAWKTFQKKLKRQAKKVRFIKKGEMYSFEGKTNGTGWMFVDNHIEYGDLSVPLFIKEKDGYAQEALRNRVKYVRIVKKHIRGKNRYFAQLIMEGIAPPKRNKDGSFKFQLGNGRVGGDIGTSSIAVVGEKQIFLSNLADEIKSLAHEIKLIQRKMDRSKRMMNPNNYNEDGTVKKCKKTWVYSKRYQRYKAKLKELHRKQADKRKQSHNRLANHLLSFGDEHYWEDMNIKALQKRAKKTEVSEKTGKFKKKKRFGKTIGHRAPAMFLSILEQKVKRYGGSFKKVNTKSFKASQYDHKTKEYNKKKLSDRWHVFDDRTKVQRDLYSGFLLRNSNISGTKPNQKLCEATFKEFKNFHDEYVKQLERLHIHVLNSGIIVKEKAAEAA